MGKGAELHPTERIFRRKKTSFFSDTFHSQQIGVLLNLPKQVSCPSSPSFPFSCLCNTWTIICNSFYWKIHSDGCSWLLCFPAFSDWEWGSFLLIIQRENNQNQGQNAILTPFHTSLGVGGLWLQHVWAAWAAALSSNVGHSWVVWSKRELWYTKLWLWF